MVERTKERLTAETSQKVLEMINEALAIELPGKSDPNTLPKEPQSRSTTDSNLNLLDSTKDPKPKLKPKPPKTKPKPKRNSVSFTNKEGEEDLRFQ